MNYSGVKNREVDKEEKLGFLICNVSDGKSM